MDWAAAIEKNREALKGVLATLVAMVDAFTSPLWGGRRETSGGGRGVADTPALPRHLHRTILRLLRPAEAAARRLIVVAARGLVVPPSAPSKPRKPRPNPTILRHRSGTGIVMPPAAAPARVPRRLSLSLLDPLPSPHRWPARSGAPRISLPGFSARLPVPTRRQPLADDPVSAARVTLRLEALGRALDDLPAQAQRLARWRASRGAASGQATDARHQSRQRFRRISPLRPGRPPGWREKPTHAVHDILTVVHGLAFWALEPPDTS